MEDLIREVMYKVFNKLKKDGVDIRKVLIGDMNNVVKRNSKKDKDADE